MKHDDNDPLRKLAAALFSDEQTTEPDDQDEDPLDDERQATRLLFTNNES